MFGAAARRHRRAEQANAVDGAAESPRRANHRARRGRAPDRRRAGAVRAALGAKRILSRGESGVVRRHDMWGGHIHAAAADGDQLHYGRTQDESGAHRAGRRHHVRGRAAARRAQHSSLGCHGVYADGRRDVLLSLYADASVR